MQKMCAIRISTGRTHLYILYIPAYQRQVSLFLKLQLYVTSLTFPSDSHPPHSGPRTPMQAVDYFYVPGPGISQSQRMPYTFGIQPDITFRCLRCPVERNKHLWSLRALKQHLVYK